MRGAVVGFGGQGRNHFLALQKLGVDVVAVCDKNSDRFDVAKNTVQSWQQFAYPSSVDFKGRPPTFYTDWRAMFATEQIDVLGVASWTKTHTPIVIEAATRGVRAILCEKPIATSLVSARKMIDMCRKHGTLLSINYTRRWWEEHRKVRELVALGAIGELRHLWLSCGGCRLGDLSIHFIDWMRWLTGSDIDHVIGYCEELNEPNPRGSQFRDPPGRLYLIFQNGVDGVIHLGRNIALPPRFEIVGTRGRVLIEEHAGINDRWEVRVRPEQSPLVGTTDYYGPLEQRDYGIATGRIEWQGLVQAALRELMAGQTSCEGEEGYKSLEGLVAAHLSHERNHVPVRIPLSGADALRKTLTIA